MLMAWRGQNCRQLRHWMQSVPKSGRPPTILMFPFGQSEAHWPQPMHLPVTVKAAAFFGASFGHTEASSLLNSGADGALSERTLFFTSEAIFAASSSERFCAFSGVSGGIISVCGISQMHALWCEMPAW